jgi:hypothetical protein
MQQRLTRELALLSELETSLMKPKGRGVGGIITNGQSEAPWVLGWESPYDTVPWVLMHDAPSISCLLRVRVGV